MKVAVSSLPRIVSGEVIESEPQHEFDCVEHGWLLPQVSFSSELAPCCNSLPQQELLLTSVAESLPLQESVSDSF